MSLCSLQRLCTSFAIITTFNMLCLAEAEECKITHFCLAHGKIFSIRCNLIYDWLLVDTNPLIYEGNNFVHCLHSQVQRYGVCLKLCSHGLLYFLGWLSFLLLSLDQHLKCTESLMLHHLISRLVIKKWNKYFIFIKLIKWTEHPV